MVIRVDKCSTFGIKKSSTSSIHYLPKLLINQAVVPTVKMGKSVKYLGSSVGTAPTYKVRGREFESRSGRLFSGTFTFHLGRYFNFSMDNVDHMSEVLGIINNLMSKIDAIPCHPKNKLLLYHQFVLSKLSWHFSISDFSKTWIVENIDSLVSRYVPQWLELPISATLSSLLISKC